VSGRATFDTRPGAAPLDAYWTERRVHAMGSDAHIVAGDAPAGVVDWAVAELERLEQCWSRFRPDSELTLLNATAGAWTGVGRDLLLALTCAADLHRATAGRFDPTILDALERAGYDRTFELVRDGLDADAPAAALRSAPGFAAVDIDTDNARVRIPAGTRIDLGGVGKGLAADLIARGLVDRGARTAIVGLGGDLRARGEAPPEGWWDIPVLDPFDETRVAFRFPLTQGAIVTSTTRIRRWTRGGREHHHLVDPTTGDSARTGIAAVVATARDAWWAEGIAKSIIVGGIDAGIDLAQASAVRAWLFLDDGRMLETGPAR
jgi:thiamine biosynthesis lipoprotein